MRRGERSEPEPVDEAGVRRRMEVGEHGPESPEVRSMETPAVDFGRGITRTDTREATASTAW